MVAAILFALAVSSGAPARVFSDVCREPQSDDAAGRMVVLRRGPHGWQVGYSATEGALDAPTPARRVSYDPASGRLAFEARTWETLRFRGRVTGARLVGVMRRTGARPSPIDLAEVAGEDSPLPACR